MSTLIYSPGIKVYIATQHLGIVDVSEDIINGSLVRRSDGVSTFDFSFNNPRRKYDGVFTPNDRIIVVMKRISWLRVFTGYLNSVPLITAWPRVVSISASCSLKRLQYFYWDSYTSASNELVRKALADSLQKGDSTDGGITNVILTLLKEVVGWDASKVHLGKIPETWFNYAFKIAQEVEKEANLANAASQLFNSLSGRGVLGGVGAGGAASAGNYGGVNLDADQATNASTIYNTGVALGASLRDITIALMTAMQESSMKNLTSGDRDSVGLFQQRPSQGWGSVAELTDPGTAAFKFFQALFKVANRNKMSLAEAAQAVQRSAYPFEYEKWQTFATQFVNGMAQANASPNSSVSPEGVAATLSGAALLNLGLQLVENHKIPYRQGPLSDAQFASDNPPYLDCSAFVKWCYVHLTGRSSIPRTAQAQANWCSQNGGMEITPLDAMSTPGALLFKYGAGTHIVHVEMSVGDGKNTVGAHHTGTVASVTRSKASYWDIAYTVPGLTYPNVGQGTTSPLPTDSSSQSDIAFTTANTLAGYNAGDKFDSIFGNVFYPSDIDPSANALADSLVGVRALMNDQPFGIYLKNLFYSVLRSFCSAPNGDLIAWFPDYYGIWGTAGKMVVEPIEVKDFVIEWSDDSMVTHQYVVAGQAGTNILDISTGDGGGSTQSNETEQLIQTTTVGIATIDIESIMTALYGLDQTEDEAKKFANNIYQRFGARPNYLEMPSLQGPKAEFFAALFMFQRNWAYQYNADVQLTFMPELYPGMLLQIPAFHFQAYVTTVTHNFDMSSGFSTTVNICAPARMGNGKDAKTNALIGLPVAGGFKPSLTADEIKLITDQESYLQMRSDFNTVPSPLLDRSASTWTPIQDALRNIE